MITIALKKTKLHSSIISFLGISSLVLSSAASAAWIQSSLVTDNVIDNNNGTWSYEFTVLNTSADDSNNDRPSPNEPIIIDWELPYFDDMDINDIYSPIGWSSAIETIGTANSLTGWDGEAVWQDPNDPFYAGVNSPYTTGTQVLHWYCNFNFNFDGGEAGGCFDDGYGVVGDVIRAGDQLSGFGFTSSFASTAAPYQASWATLPIQTGDPAFPFAGGVGSPKALGTSSIPEPASLALLGLGLVGLYGAKRRRRSNTK